MKWRLRDTLVVLTAVCVVSGASAALYNDRTIRLHSDGEPIGRTVLEEGDTYRRDAARNLWEELSASRDIYNRNYVRTEAASHLRLDIVGRTRLDLHPQSMIFVHVEDESVDVDLRRGRLHIEHRGSERPLVLHSEDGEKIILENGAVDAQRNQDGSWIVDVRRGHALHASAEASRPLYYGDVVRLAAAGQEATYEERRARLQQPRAGTGFLTDDESHAVDFHWSGSARILQVRTQNPGFESDSYEAQLTEDQRSHSLDLTPGRYYWRLADANRVPMSATSFFYIKARGPIPIELVSAHSGLTARWDGDVQGRYLVSVFDLAASQNTPRLISSLPVRRSFVNLALDDGDYAIQVRSEETGRESALWPVTIVDGQLQQEETARDHAESLSAAETREPASVVHLGPREVTPVPIESENDAGREMAPESASIPGLRLLEPAAGEIVDMSYRDELHFAWSGCDAATLRLADAGGREIFQAQSVNSPHTFSDLEDLREGDYVWELACDEETMSITFHVLLGRALDQTEFIE